MNRTLVRFAIVVLGAGIVFAFPIFVHAAEIQIVSTDLPTIQVGSFSPPIVPIAGEGGKGPLAILVNFYYLALGLGGALAFSMILWGAIKYMTAGGSHSALDEAKEIVTEAFLGLLLLVGAYLVLSVVNPDLTNLQLPFLERLEPAKKSEGAPVVAMSSSTSWQAIQASAVGDPALRKTLLDIRRAMGSGRLWPNFNLADHGLIIVDSRSAPSSEYCLGKCIAGKQEDLWQRPTPNGTALGRPQNGVYTFAPAQSFEVTGGQDSIMALWFREHKEAVTTAIHEDFHVSYQSRYSDALEGRASSWSRSTLESTYAQRPATLNALRKECSALAAALRFGSRSAALPSLREFIATREARRSLSGAPELEENAWERTEGVAQLVEHRAGASLGITDPSNLIDAAVRRGLCATFPGDAYLSLLGGLEAAVLDAFGDPSWPSKVYASGTSRSLYGLIKDMAGK